MTSHLYCVIWEDYATIKFNDNSKLKMFNRAFIRSALNLYSLEIWKSAYVMFKTGQNW